MTPTLKRMSASAAAMPISAETTSKLAAKPEGHSTCQAKNTARLAMTPTTAAVMPVSGAVSRKLPCVDSMKGPPSRMKKNDGRKVKKVTTAAAAAPERNKASLPKMARVQPPTQPTNETTMIN